MQLTAHNDGCYYKIHNDAGSEKTANREISYVYYFYQEPKAFSGGELKIYDTELKGGGAKENADIAIKILSGEKGPKRDIVLLNAAAGIVVGGQAKDLEDGFRKAADSVDSGSALAILRKLSE